MVRTRQLTPDDWQTYKEIRLRALATNPEAFGSTLARAQQMTDEEWRGRLATSAFFVAEAGGAALGLAGGHRREDFGELISMWVAPDARGTGLASRLIEDVINWAAAEGYPEVRLWVVEGNVAAARAYEKSGFRPTGRRQPVREGEPAMELEMGRATSHLR